MRRVLFLLGDAGKARNDNHRRLPAAFADLGWTVTTADHDALRVRDNALTVDRVGMLDFDLVWPLGFGRQATFFDRMQLLRQAPQARFVTTVDALVYLHGKHRWLEHQPPTHTSNDPAELRRLIEQGGEWVLKPTAGSYGRDVCLVRDAGEGRRALERLARLYPDGYLILQRYVPEARSGEKRSIVAGGEIVASYLRAPADGLLANVTAGARVSRTTLSGTERSLVETVAAGLAETGAGFAAVDTVYPYLMEVNVANPGGLETLASLGDATAAARSVTAICRWRAVAP